MNNSYLKKVGINDYDLNLVFEYMYNNTNLSLKSNCLIYYRLDGTVCCIVDYDTAYMKEIFINDIMLHIEKPRNITIRYLKEILSVDRVVAI